MSLDEHPSVDAVLDAIKSSGRPRAIPQGADAWIAHCPACDPDLKAERGWIIGQNGKGAGLRCSRGCSSDEIRAAMNDRLKTREIYIEIDGEKVPALDYARRHLRLPNLRGVIKRGLTDSLYDLELDDRTLIPIGPYSHLKDPRKVEDQLGDIAGITLDYISGPKFRPIARALRAIATLDDDGTTPENVTCAWLANFIRGHDDRLADLDDPEIKAWAAGVSGGSRGYMPGAFRDTHDRLWVHRDDFTRHVRNVERVGTTEKDVSARLKRLCFTSDRVEAPHTARSTRKPKRRYWRSEPGFYPQDHA